MFSVWMSVKDNMNCRSKLTDVIQRGERPRRRRSNTLDNNITSELSVHSMRRISCTLDNDITDELSVHPTDSEMQEETFAQKCTRKWFTVLETGDPSRIIIEMIFRAASTRTSHHSRKIKDILRVQNSIETLERFEKYRETVKNGSTEKYRKHPRSMVDGNEKLLFYATTINCCTVKTSGVPKLCRDSTCGVCRILQSGFSTAHKSKNGIRLSNCWEELNQAPNPVTKGKNVKSVVIVCRVIAGRVVDMVERESDYDYDSVTCGKLNYLLVKHPSAVLPCFVIVLE